MTRDELHRQLSPAQRVADWRRCPRCGAALQRVESEHHCPHGHGWSTKRELKLLRRALIAEAQRAAPATDQS